MSRRDYINRHPALVGQYSGLLVSQQQSFRMKALLIVFVIGVVYSQHGLQLPHGHNLQVLVDHAFDRVDHINKDGQVTIAEFNLLIERDDANNDTCVTYDEYKAALNPNSPLVSVSREMYDHFDPDGDDCLDTTEMGEEFHKIDKDGNGLLSMKEFEHFYTNLLHHLYAHVPVGK